jgi:hypothetical protein
VTKQATDGREMLSKDKLKSQLTRIPFQALVKAQKCLGVSAQLPRKRRRSDASASGGAESDVEGGEEYLAKKKGPRRGREAPRHQAAGLVEAVKSGLGRRRPGEDDKDKKKKVSKEVPKRSNKHA